MYLTDGAMFDCLMKKKRKIGQCSLSDLYRKSHTPRDLPTCATCKAARYDVSHADMFVRAVVAKKPGEAARIGVSSKMIRWLDDYVGRNKPRVRIKQG